MDPFMPDDRKLVAIRELLPSLASGIRLDTTMAGPFPAETDRAVRQLTELELRLGRGGPDRADDMAQRMEEAAAVVAAVLATTPDRVVLAPGPIAALSATIVATAPAALAIDDVVTGMLGRAAATLADVHGLPVVEGGDGRSGPWLLVAPHVDGRTGAVLATRGRADETHANGGLLVLDMGWSAGAVPVDAPSSGADLALVETHRWLLGPEGVTALWAADPVVAARIRRAVDPVPAPLLLGVARSVGWLLMYVSLPWAFERVEALARRLRAALAPIEGVGLEQGADPASAVVPFRIAGWTAHETAAELARRVHAHVDVEPGRDLVVASVGAWILDGEVDRFAAAVAEIAAHTPATLPRRPLLTVIAPAWDEP